MVFCWKLKLLHDRYELKRFNVEEAANIDVVTRQLPKGGYTTFRTYQAAKVLRFKDHIDRLIKTASLSDITLDINNTAIRKAVREALNALGTKRDKRVRLVVDFEKKIGDIYLLVDELITLPDECYQFGVSVLTNDKIIRHNPKAKLTSFINDTYDIRKNITNSINEILLVNNDGFVLEGISSNFFAVKNGVIHTSESHILFGITRSIVISVIKNNRLKLSYDPLNIDEITAIDEAFLTSSSRGVLPVTNINDVQINSGKIGKITELIYKQTRSQINSEIEEI